MNQAYKDQQDFVLNISKQNNLLEDSESRTKREFNELQSQVKTLNELNQQLNQRIKDLESQLANKNKSWLDFIYKPIKK